MHVLVDVVEREIIVDFFSDVEQAKSELSRRLDEAWGVHESEVCEDGMSAWASGKVDSDWFITEIPISDHLREKFEEFKGMTGWRGLDAENAIESFVRFVGKE